MTREENGNPVRDESREFEAEVQRAMRAAGPRDELAHGELSPADFRMHHDAALMVWQRQQRVRRRRRAWGGIAVAAAVVFGVVFVGSWLDPASAPQTTIAESFGLMHADGDVEVLEPGSDDESWRRAAEGQPVALGSRVRTGAGAAVIRSSAPDGPELRLDGGSELTLEALARTTLMRGRVYVDTGEHGAASEGKASAPRMRVATSFGDALDIGTQFEVRVGETSLGVRVRSGRVEVRRGDLAGSSSGLLVEPGSGVEVFADGRVERNGVDVADGSWDWSGRLAAPFELDGATLAAYLDWLRRETGWALRFESATARAEAESIRLSGSSTAGLLPAETVDLVLPSAGYIAERTADGLAIRPAR